MPRPVTIDWCLNGWKVKIGCQEVVFNDVRELLVDLREYLRDPTATEKRFVKESVNAELFATDEPQRRRVTAAVGAFPDVHIGDYLEPDESRAHGEPVEQIIERLGALERDTDTRLDHLSQRIDNLEDPLDERAP